MDQLTHLISFVKKKNENMVMRKSSQMHNKSGQNKQTKGVGVSCFSKFKIKWSYSKINGNQKNSKK